MGIKSKVKIIQKNNKDKKTKKNNGFIKNLKWRDISIGKKYLASIIIAATFFLVATLVVYLQLAIVEKNIKHLEEASLNTRDMMEISTLTQIKDVQIADYIITNNEKYIEEFEILQEQFVDVEKKIVANMETEEQLEMLSIVQENNNSINDMFTNIINAGAYSGNYINLMREQSNLLRDSTIETIDTLVEKVLNEQNSAMESTSKSLTNSILILAITSFIAILVGIIIVFIISRTIITNLNRVVNITDELANGNLAVESLSYKGRDEIGQLSRGINKMKNSISNILFKITDAAQAISTSSGELIYSVHAINESADQVALTMQSISTGAETQANSTSNLSKNMVEFVKTVHTSEQEGRDIVLVSNHVLNQTVEGAILMKESVEQMKRIDSIVADAVNQVIGLDKQSNKISQLVMVIRNIADQTNLLSLNATIEAARAGEYGKGFAVVATEIRKLAEQVSTSVTEITEIVTNIQVETGQVATSLNKGYEEVKEGTKQIEKTGENFVVIDNSVTDMIKKIIAISNDLKGIMGNSDHMNDLIQDIASVSEEAAAGVEQTATAIEETSSSMSEISNNAHSLADLSKQLNREIGVFNLK